MSRRCLPAMGEQGDFYWTAGAQEELHLGWCEGCSCYLHPSRSHCPDCFRPAVSRAASGRGRLVSFTENHQAWLEGHPPPYIVCLVAVEEDESIRLTSNLLIGEEGVPQIGASVAVRFVHHEDVWLPVFALLPSVDIRELDTAPPLCAPAIQKAGNKFEDKVILAGVGVSEVGRRLSQSEHNLTHTACLNAIADAGLSLADIDGVCAYPGSTGLPGLSDGGVRAMAYSLGLNPLWHAGAAETPGQTGPIISAMLAVASGMCRHVLCFTSFSERRRPISAISNHGRVTGELRWQLPYGAATPVNWVALAAQHYLHKYQASREVFAQIAVASRRNAQRNDSALYRTQLSHEQYFDARIISSPFGLYDCDIPCDGAVAVVVSRAEMAHDLPQPPIFVDAVGTRICEPQSWDQSTITHQPNTFGPASHMWSRSDMNTSDVDLALLYDGFTFNVVSWLEALGFCGPGQAQDYIGDGRLFDVDGELPLNPHGGHLSAGRSNGWGHLVEAIFQLRRDAGIRQVKDASVAVVSCGGSIPANAMLLRA